MVAYSFNKRFVPAIMLGLQKRDDGRTIESLDISGHVIRHKRQTIRAIGKRRHARPGETLQLYHGMRTKQCSKIGEAICTEIAPISIWPSINPDQFAIKMQADFAGKTLDEFAQADGFASLHDMWEFWVDNHGVHLFEGLLIRWEPLP